VAYVQVGEVLNRCEQSGILVVLEEFPSLCICEG